MEKLPGFYVIGSVASRIGTYAPAYCTALGKALLAFLPEDEVRTYYTEKGLNPRTPNTITDVNTLIGECRKVKERGYALDFEELEPDLYCVAAPVLGDDHNALAAISVSGPDYRIGSRIQEGELIQVVREAARSISHRLTETRARIVRGQVKKIHP